MSNVNPYETGPASAGDAMPRPLFRAAGSGVPFDEGLIRKVRVQPIGLLKRAHAFLGDRYWLFLGITLVAVLLGSLVPLNLILGALTVGVFLCLIEHEAGRRVELALLFKGFEYFVDSLIVILVVMAVSFAIILPLTIVMFVGVFGAVAAMGEGNNSAGAVLLFGLFPLMFVAILAASMLIYLPFVFTFQLIADQKLKASDALRLGWKGSQKNFGGIFVLLLVFGLIGFVGALFCYIPLVFFMPLAFTANFLLYRDVYRDVAPPASAAPVPVATPAD